MVERCLPAEQEAKASKDAELEYYRNELFWEELEKKNREREKVRWGEGLRLVVVVCFRRKQREGRRLERRCWLLMNTRWS